MKTENTIHVETQTSPEAMFAHMETEQFSEIVNELEQSDITRDEAIASIAMYKMQTDVLEEQVKEISSQRDGAIELLIWLEEQLKDHPTIHLTSHFRK